MILSAEIKEAVDLCLESNIPFTAYCLPGDDHPEFFSNPWGRPAEKGTSIGLSVNFWGSNRTASIFAQLDAKATLEQCRGMRPLPEAALRPQRKSTSYQEYSSMVETILSKLRIRGGKTVLSRIECGEMPRRPISEIAQEYFSVYPNTFRYLYFTQETGCWIGASPEIIIDHHCSSDRFITMSLAGTREAAEKDAPWDQKNIEEHEYVTRFIVETLESLGLKAKVFPQENISLGKIEHLCNRIESRFEGVSFQTVLEHLSPTPALAGYPMEPALEEIAQTEAHRRYCYGGYLALETLQGSKAFVNLRCAHFDKKSFCIYSGGGITVDSTPSQEWEEAISKVTPLRQLLKGTAMV